MNHFRRKLLQSAALLGAGSLISRSTADAQHQHHPPPAKTPPAQSPPQQSPPPASPPPSAAQLPHLPILEPDLTKLPWQWDNGVKVFRLNAEVVQREFLPGRAFYTWGFNGSCPGPTIECVEGDRVRIIVENRLPESTSIHWHGLEVPIEMDGVMGISQDPTPPGGSHIYEFTIHQNGSFFYHSHMPMQQMMGMIGLFIVHPRTPHSPRVDRDFGLIVQEWAILPNNPIPNSLSMEFNWLTINGRAGPATTPLVVKQGERVRIRFVNLGMDHHPMHLHGNTFWVTGTEGLRIPPSAWIPGNTVLVGVAQARDVEFDAKFLGDWMLHCHLPHHNMNHMASMVGPMAHAGHGAPAGLGMEEGMGMLKRGHALSPENGPSFGRAMGVGATFEEKTRNGPLAAAAQQSHQHHTPAQTPAGDPALVPGFPQDHMMVVDDLVAKPETFGLRPGWSAAVVGMMTLLRVVPPDLFDQIAALKKSGAAPAAEHKHES